MALLMVKAFLNLQKSKKKQVGHPSAVLSPILGKFLRTPLIIKLTLYKISNTINTMQQFFFNAIFIATCQVFTNIRSKFCHI